MEKIIYGVRKTIQKYHTRIIFLLLCCILCTAAYLRLYHIEGYMTFLGDEGRDVLIVKRMIVDHKWTLLGPTASVGGFFLGPIYYYFMIPFLWAFHLNPVGPAVMVAFFGIGTVFLVYKAGKDFFDETTGLIAASLYALSPVVIAYSRSSWNPNLVPFFSLLLIWFLWKIVTDEKWNLLFVVGLILGIGIQLHYLFLFLFVLSGIWIVRQGQFLQRMKYYLFGITGFVLGYAPFLLFEIRHGFPNTYSIIRFLLAGKDTGLSGTIFIKNSIDVAYRLFGRMVFRLPQPEIWSSVPLWQQIVWDASIWGTCLLGLLFLYRYFISETQPVRARNASQLLALWFVVEIILFGLYKRAIYDYYFGIFFAFPFLITGFVCSRLFRMKRLFFVVFLLFLSVVYYNWEGRPFRFPPNNQLAQIRRIAQTAYDKTDGKPYNFALIAPLNSDHSYRFFFETLGIPPVTIENTANDPLRKTVTDQLIVICEDPNCQPLGNSLWEIAGFGRAEITGFWDVPFVRIYKLVHYATKNETVKMDVKK